MTTARARRSDLTELLVCLLYLWSRDASIPVEEMHDYCLQRVGWWPQLKASYSDTERQMVARQIVDEAELVR